MKSLLVILFTITAVCSAEVLFEDYFDDGNADGWFEFSENPDSAYYYVEDYWYHLEIHELDAHIGSVNGDISDTTPHHMSIPDYSIYCKLNAFPDTQYAGVGGRFQSPPTDELGYVIWLKYDSNSVQIWRADGPNNVTTLTSAYFTLEYEEEYWIRFDLWGGLLQGKVWQGSLGDEPGTYLLSAYDATYTEPGSVVVAAFSWGFTESHAAFDSVIVCNPLSLEQSTWAGIKSMF